MTKVYGSQYINLGDVSTEAPLRPEPGANGSADHRGHEEPPSVSGPGDYGANDGAKQQRANGGERAKGDFAAGDDAHGVRIGLEAKDIDPSTAFTFLGDAPASAPRELIKKLLP